MKQSKRMKDGRVATLAVVLTLGLMGTAQATVFDFADLAIGNEGAFDSVVIDGLKVTATAFAPSSSPVPYLDDLAFGGKPAGLGVCKQLGTDGECDPSDDDNITTNEVVELYFSTIDDVPVDVTITRILFRNEVHETTFINGAQFDLSTDFGESFTSYSLVHEFTTPLGPDNTFQFGYVNDQFYLSLIEVSRTTRVPEPGLLSLLGVALVGLGVARRRSRPDVRS